MTIEELKQYQHLQSEVRFWQKELEKTMQRSYVKAPELTGLPGPKKLADPVARRAMEEAEILQTIRMMQRRSARMLREIVAFIKEVEDPLVRTIIYGRYIKGMTWSQLASNVGGRNTADSLRKLHNRYFRRQ